MKPEGVGLSYTLTIRMFLADVPGTLGKVTSVIGRAGGNIGAVDLVSVDGGRLMRDITVKARDEEHGKRILDTLKRLSHVKVVAASDRTFLLHLGGKMRVECKIPVKTRDDLSMVYTPGVGRVSLAIHEKPELTYHFTIKRNTVAIVTDGSAVLGLGNIGPRAALPVMEGKAMLFKEFAGVDAFPICLDTQDPQEIIETVVRIAPVFGGVNLEDIAAPKCFEVERELQARLDIPIFHDDQHGTAIVVLASLLNATKVVRKNLQRLKVVVAGVGAAGVAVSKILLRSGVRDIIGCDRHGAVYPGRPDGMNPAKEEYAQITNPRRFKGSLEQALKGADVFIGLSGPNVIKPRALRKMARRAIVFALANPVPEVDPVEAHRYAAVVATGRSDFQNQINNALAFPGLFRGALDVRARAINEAMKVAAARALAQVVKPSELGPDYIIPSIFNRSVSKLVAEAVAKAAVRTGLAHRTHLPHLEVVN